LESIRAHILIQTFRGAQESPSKTTLPDYDPKCYLCPGNQRAQGDINPKYESTFVFVNDYSAVKEEQADYEPNYEDGTLIHGAQTTLKLTE
jgi:UDPglucose--hexose-1-phosphate uridylyltransferase